MWYKKLSRVIVTSIVNSNYIAYFAMWDVTLTIQKSVQCPQFKFSSLF